MTAINGGGHKSDDEWHFCAHGGIWQRMAVDGVIWQLKWQRVTAGGG
jgi:hypothetical protein